MIPPITPLPPLAHLNTSFQSLLHRVEEVERLLIRQGVDRGVVNTAALIFWCNEATSPEDVVAIVLDQPLARTRES